MRNDIRSLVHGVFAVLLLVPAAGIAQEQGAASPPQRAAESVKGVELKGKAPVNPQTLRVSLPKPQEAVLANGLRVALLEDRRLPIFSLQLVIGGGGLADPADRPGLAMVTAMMLREGAGKRISREIAEHLAVLGSSLLPGATPSSGESSVYVSGLSENLDATLGIAADVIREPTFPADELDKLRARLLSRLQYQRTLPSFLAQEQFMRAVYGEHPARNVVPPETALRAMTSADLAKYHATWYRPNNTLLIAHGDIALRDLLPKLERAFGSWAKAEVPAVALPALQAPDRLRVWLIERPASVQTSLLLGGLGIKRNSDDYFAMLVMNYILGGSPASRLFMNLRENKGYTYGVSSSFTGSQFPGVIVANADVRTDVTEGALRELMAEIGRIGRDAVTADELRDAQRALVGRFALSLDNPQTLVANFATQRIYGLPADYWDTYPQRVEAITAQDIQRVAKKYYGERLQIVAVGDGAAVRKVLERYGTVEMPL